MGERKLADHALLQRSNYSSAELKAQWGRDDAKAVCVIDRLRGAMVMADLEPAVWETVAFSHAAVLSRLGDEGEGPRGGGQAVTPEKRGI